MVCVVPFLALRFLAGRGLGRATGAVKVLARCPLEPRRSVYLIETAGRCFLVGVGEGPMALLAEVDAAQVRASSPAVENAGTRFSDVLARVLARPAPPPPTAPTSESKG